MKARLPVGWLAPPPPEMTWDEMKQTDTQHAFQGTVQSTVWQLQWRMRQGGVRVDFTLTRL